MFGSFSWGRAEQLHFLNYYNHDGPHSAVGDDVPASRVPGRDLRLTVQPVEALPIAALPIEGPLSLDDLDVDTTS